VGAASLVLVKPPPVRAALVEATFDLASQARAHLLHARGMAPRLPAAAAAALLPAEPVAAFLDRLEAQRFDVFAGGGGLGPWRDGRPHARLTLHAKLLKHALLNTF
jgi:phytoene/squalene synthetase